MKRFEPDFQNIQDAARNIQPRRLPLYEHIISIGNMEKVLGESFGGLYSGSCADKVEFFKKYCAFFLLMGYDTVSFEGCIGSVMPGSGALGGHVDPVIKDRADFEKYPWEEIPDLYFRAFSGHFSALREAMPAGMKAVGGPGNGIFECVQELTGYMNLCYLSVDDPELYSDLFSAVGRTNLRIWERFLKEFGDIYCVLRFGDDMGHKSNTLLAAEDLRANVLPHYKPIVQKVHEYGKPFLLHSCGAIFSVMDDLIDGAGIDAKHSNEDQIAPFPYWVEQYGDRIGNFGGIDTDAVCRLDPAAMTEYIHEVLAKCEGCGGFAFGSGNSIPDYVPVEQFIHMTEVVRRHRGDYR